MNNYKLVWTGDKQVYLHRKVWEDANGEIPEGMMIDHINGEIRDNRLENLRCVTRSENGHNTGKTKGFHFDKRNKYRPWIATIMKDRVKIHIGSYATMIDARASYLRKYRELLGEDFNGRA